MKKVLWLCLLLLCVGALLVACNGSKGNEQPTEPPVTEAPAADPNAFYLSDCVITRPQGGKNDLSRDWSRSISNALKSYTGVSVQMADDFTLSDGIEILVGKTNRAESEQVLSEMAGEQFAFSIRRVNNKLVILGTTEEMTATGVLYFIETLIPQCATADGALNLEKDFSYVSTAQAVKLVDNAKTSYSVVADDSIYLELRTDMNAIGDKLKTVATSTNRVKVVRDDAGADGERDSSAKEILLGSTYYAETETLRARMGYNQYGIAVVGNKIVIFGYSTEALDGAIELFYDILERNTNGKNIYLPDGMIVLCTNYDMKMDIPPFSAPMQDLVEVDGNAYMAYITNTTEVKFNEYGATLEQAGYTKYATNAIGACKFATYIADKKTVNVTFDATQNTVQVICDNSNDRPLTEELNEYVKRCDPLLIQIGLTYLKADTGMSYAIRLADGRFVVIDGGCTDFDDDEKLYDTLKAHTVDGGEPVIAAWFLTHAHSDHYQAFLKFAGRYGSKVKIETVVYNLPTEYFCSSLVSEAAKVESQVNAISGAKVIYARTGQKFHIADATFEILLTPEDFYPSTCGNDQNDTSVVFKITIADQTVMILGDSAYNAAPILLRRYKGDDFNALQSDIMQMAHHGYDGVDALYRAIDPTIVLWPSPDHWFHESQRWEATNIENYGQRWIFNKYIMTSPKITEIFNSGHGTVVLTLPYTSPATGRVHPNSPAPTYNKGDVIYYEDFEDVEKIYQTGWWALNSLVEAYKITDLSIEERTKDNGILMVGRENSVLGFVRPDLLRGVRSYTLEMDLVVDSLGTASEGDGFGIWYNDNRPIESKNRSLYKITKTGKLTLRMEVDLDAGTTKIYINNAYQGTLTNASNSEGGLMFWSKNAEVFVGKIKLTAGVNS